MRLNRGQQNKGTLILNMRLRHLLHTSTRGSGKFQAEPVCFLFSWQKGIAFKCSLELHSYALITAFFRST